VESLGSAVGIATGTSYVANIGFRGDRELISIGSCANLAAKVIDGTDTIIVTGESYGLLPRCLKEHFVGWRTVAETRTFKAEGLRWSTHSELARELGVDYNADRLAAKTEEYRDSLPLSEMAISDASSLIDPERLSERRSKRTSAVALFADLDGFTRYVHEAEEDDDVVSLVRALHMVRHEFHAVIKQDYPGVVLQHQGDGVLAVVHMPPGDELRKRCQNAIDVAIGLQSSMDHILNKRLSGRGDIHVAVGLDVGATLITRLGKKGKREIICLGPKVSSAERLQLRSRGQEIRISQAVYDAIDRETLASQFATESSDVYVAKKLTFPRLDELEEEEAARRGRLESVVVGSRIEVETSGHRQQRPWGNAKPWCARQ